MNSVASRLILVSSTMVAFVALPAKGMGGHAERQAEVKIETVSEDGLSDMSVSNSILTGEEIKFLDIGRRYLLTKYGESARDWPIMVDVQSKFLQYFDRSEHRFVIIPISDLTTKQK